MLIVLVFIKGLSLICSLCLCVMVTPLYTGRTPLPHMVCADPESGTDHSLKEVSAYIIWYRVHTWGLQGKQVIFCALLCIFTNNIHVKNSSAEGACKYDKYSVSPPIRHGGRPIPRPLQPHSGRGPGPVDRGQ